MVPIWSSAKACSGRPRSYRTQRLFDRHSLLLPKDGTVHILARLTMTYATTEGSSTLIR